MGVKNVSDERTNEQGDSRSRIAGRTELQISYKLVSAQSFWTFCSINYPKPNSGLLNLLNLTPQEESE